MKLAIAGATGNVGREIIRLLEQSPHESFHAAPLLIASDASAAEEIPFGENTIEVKTFDEADFKNIDVMIFATSKEISQKHIPQMLEKNIQVIDLSGAYRSDENVPVLVHHVNGKTVEKDKEHVTIADVATIQLATILKPILEKVTVKRVMSTMLYPTSRGGKMAMDELFRQSAGLLGGAGIDIDEGEEFAHQVAFNVIPQVGEFTGANTDAETGLLLELNRVLKNPTPVVSTAVYVPTFIGMSQCVTLDIKGVMSAKEVQTILSDVHGVSVIDSPENKEYSTPYGTAETAQIYVSRIREDALSAGIIQLFITCDNLRAGAAQEVMNRLEYCLQN